MPARRFFRGGRGRVLDPNMKAFAPMTALLVVAMAACRSPDPAPAAEALPSASPPAPPPDTAAPPDSGPSAAPAAPAPPAGALSQEEAVARVLALPEVKALPWPKAKAVAWAADPVKEPCQFDRGNPCPGPGEIEVRAGVEDGGQRSPELRFFVSLAGGSIEVDSGFQLHTAPEPQRMPYAVWSPLNARRMLALDIVNSLPEVVAWSQWLERMGTRDQPLSMALWTERFPGPGCDKPTSECAFGFYVGEDHIGSHSVRWSSFSVHPEARRIGVIGYSAIEETYDAWKAKRPGESGAKEFQRLDGPFPALSKGRGDLGYGAPSKVVDDMMQWGHPAKGALAKRGFAVTRVELYLDGAYPAFFVRPAPGGRPLHERAAKDPWEVRLAAHGILRANGGFAFELIEDASGARSRYRYRGRDRTFERLVGEEWKLL